VIAWVVLGCLVLWALEIVAFLVGLVWSYRESEREERGEGIPHA
jgi:hypothetical protein